MSTLAEINPQSATPWLWFAGSIVAYAAFLTLNPLASCLGKAYRLVRTRPHLWILPGIFGFAAVAVSLTSGIPAEPPATLSSPRDLALRSLSEAWEILPTFPHILVEAQPLSVVAAALFLFNAGGVLLTFCRSNAWTGRAPWAAGFGFATISALIHLAVGGADLFRLGWHPHPILTVLSQAFVLLTGMFVQAYLIAAAILATAPASRNSNMVAASPRAALTRAAECFPRIVPLTALYLIVWALATYGGKAQPTAFAARFVVPEILLVLAFLPPSALVVRGGFSAVGGVALGALVRSWWVWLWGLAAIFLTTFLARFAAIGLDAAWPPGTNEGTAWRLVFPLLWGALATWMLVAWIFAFREFVLPAAGAKPVPARKPARKASPPSR